MNIKMIKSSVVFLLMILAQFSTALTPLVDDAMSDVSGQSGITMDIETHGESEIGEFRYTDDGNSFSLGDIKISKNAFTVKFDISQTEAILKLTKFGVMDMSIGAIQFNYSKALADSVVPGERLTEAQRKNQYGSIGSLYINDYTLDPISDVSFKLNLEGAFVFNALVKKDSYFYLTYVDDGSFEFDPNNDGDLTDTTGKNYISSKVVFTSDFNIEDIKFNQGEKNAKSYLDVTLGDTTGGIEFQNITINGKIIGSAGFENIKVEPVSYLHIQGH